MPFVKAAKLQEIHLSSGFHVSLSVQDLGTSAKRIWDDKLVFLLSRLPNDHPLWPTQCTSQAAVCRPPAELVPPEECGASLHVPGTAVPCAS